jgi:hypothetical protein
MMGGQTLKIARNGLLDVIESFRTSLSLRDATRQRGCFGHKYSVFILLYQYSILHSLFSFPDDLSMSSENRQ